MHEKVWQIQSGIPIVFQALEVDLPPGHPHSQAWHSFKSVAGSRGRAESLALGGQGHAGTRSARHPLAPGVGTRSLPA